MRINPPQEAKIGLLGDPGHAHASTVRRAEARAFPSHPTQNSTAGFCGPRYRTPRCLGHPGSRKQKSTAEGTSTPTVQNRDRSTPNCATTAQFGEPRCWGPRRLCHTSMSQVTIVVIPQSSGADPSQARDDSESRVTGLMQRSFDSAMRPGVPGCMASLRMTAGVGLLVMQG
jgi:hypothetical protein